MTAKTTQQEQTLLESLDKLLRSEAVRAQIEPVVERVRQELAKSLSATMAWEPIPHAIYGDALPRPILSSWVFVLRGGATTGAERHPNSHQRMMSYHGIGDMQTGGEGQWQPHLMPSAQDAALEQRWISIPQNVWHQVVVPQGDDWVVVSFHTVPADELIEERPDSADSGRTKQKLYVARDDKK